TKGCLIANFATVPLYIPDLEKRLTMRCSTSRFAPWTAFKSRLCGFAAQKYSTKPQLKSCR
ncbi:hypothetical protein ACJ8GG_003861, partial [Acinetobacter baumannii]